MAGRPDPKPTRRTVSGDAGRAKLRLEGSCRACGERPDGTLRRRLERHHLVPRSLGGDDVDANLVPLCARCHDLFERGVYLRAWIGARLRVALRPEELAYVIDRKGAAFLDRYYPPQEAV